MIDTFDVTQIDYIDRFDVNGTEYLLKDSDAARASALSDMAVKKGSITLSATWSGEGPYTQTVTLSGVTANSKVDVQPDAATLQTLMDDGVSALYISNTDGTLTAYAIGAAPTAAMTIQVTVTEVSA